MDINLNYTKDSENVISPKTKASTITLENGKTLEQTLSEITISDGAKLPLSGGTMTGTISSALVGSHLDGNKGTNVLINSTATGTQYQTLYRKKSTNGVFTINGWTNNMLFGYTSDKTISDGNNKIDFGLKIMENGAIVPVSATQSIGESSMKWNSVYATTFNGNATSADKLKTARTINGVSFDGSANITVADNTKLPLSGGTLTTNAFNGLTIKRSDANGSSILFSNSAGTLGKTGFTNGGNDYIITNKSGADGTPNMLKISQDGVITSFNNIVPSTNNTRTLGTSSTKWNNVYSTTFTGVLSGNASSATKLATARKINGVEFDGTRDITISSGSSTDSFIVRLPSQIQNWALSSYDYGTPTADELKTYMTANNGEILKLLQDCCEKGKILMSTGVQSTADRKSYSCQAYLVQFLYSYDRGDYDYDNCILDITFQGITGYGTKVSGIMVPYYSGFIISNNERTDTWKWNETDYQGTGSGSGGLACFTGNMKINTSNGLRDISDINIGDKVFSYNNRTKNKELKAVDKIISHTSDKIYNINLGSEIIRTTWSHPFYVENKGKVLARDLSSGDLLRCYNDNLIAIRSIDIINEPEDVYEIRVIDNNNYYVGNNSVLVYNEESVL